MAKISLRAYNREVETLVEQGKIDQAIAHCRHTLKTFPKCLDTYRLLGKAYLEARRFSEAEDILRRLLLAVPDDFIGNLGMSIISDEQKNINNAIWYMERAFEVQPSNTAIQGELRRLYGRRDGLEPPQIRLTRGALAQMYARGNQTQQAIAEIRAILAEDPERMDLQVLLARVYHRGGQKVEATDACTELLKKYPYCLDANRIMVELLSDANRTDSTQIYRHRVNALDPYSAFVPGSLFDVADVPEQAVLLERLDFDASEFTSPADFGYESAEPAAAEAPAEQHEAWRAETGSGEEMPPAVLPEAEQAENIPDWLKAAGWGAATAEAVRRSELAAHEENLAGEPSAEVADELAQGELPDWVKSMAPAEAAGAAEPGAAGSELSAAEADQEFLASLGMPEQPAAEAGLESTQVSMTTAAIAAAAAAAMASNKEEETPAEQPQAETQAAPEEMQAATETPAEELPDWLKELEPPAAGLAVAATTMAMNEEEEAPAEQPQAETQAAPEQMQAATETSAEELPDWLKELETPAAGLAVAATAMAINEEAEAPTEEPQATTETPGEQMPKEPEEPKEVEIPAPGLAVAAAAMAMNKEEEPQAEAEEMQAATETSAEELPDWLKALVTPAAGLAVAAASMELNEEEETPAEQPQGEMQAAPEEMQAAIETPAEEIPAEPKEAEVPAPELAVAAAAMGLNEEEETPAVQPQVEMQAAPEEMQVATETPAEELPDWLKEAEAPAAEEPAAVEAEEIPDWLAAVIKEQESKAESETPGLSPLSAAVMGATAAAAVDREPSEEAFAEEPEQAADAQAQKDVSAWLAGLDQAEAQPEETAVAAAAAGGAMEESMPEEMPSVEGTGGEFSPESVEEMSPEEAFAWLESLAAKQGANPEELLTIPHEEPPAAVQEEPAGPGLADTLVTATAAGVAGAVLSHEEEAETQPEAELAAEPAAVAPAGDLDWLEGIEEEQEAEEALPAMPTATEWLPEAEPSEAAAAVEPASEEAEIPLAAMTAAGLAGSMLEESTEQEPATPFEAEEVPDWLKTPLEETTAETGKELAPTDDVPDWIKAMVAIPEPTEEPISLEETPAEAVAAAEAPGLAEIMTGSKIEIARPTPPQGDEAILEQAQIDLQRGNLDEAAAGFSRLIKRGRLLDETIYDLREATYRYPVDVIVWLTLGDACKRANRLQDALDAYTKAEELLR